jgi:hypothetical protein
MCCIRTLNDELNNQEYVLEISLNLDLGKGFHVIAAYMRTQISPIAIITLAKGTDTVVNLRLDLDKQIFIDSIDSALEMEYLQSKVFEITQCINKFACS